MGTRSTDRSPKGFGINKVLDGKLLEFFNTKRTGGGTNAPIPFSATGGTTSEPGNGYKYHFFTASGDFIVSQSLASIEYLVVAGGGAGGNYPSGNSGGGGGAGGYREGSAIIGTGTYPVVIGG